MSHTDKTRPVWVQFRDPANRRFVEEAHDHRNGVCDLEAWMQDTHCAQIWQWRSSYQCVLYNSFYGANACKFWPRPPKGCWGRGGVHGSVRMRWRKQRQQLLSGEILDGDKPNGKWYKRDMWRGYYY